MPEPDRLQLDYAPAPPRYRAGLRRYFLGLILVAFAIVAVRCLPELIQRARLVWLQRQCFDEAHPLEGVVFDTRVGSLPGMHRSDPAFVQGSFATNDTPIAYVGRVPTRWQKYAPAINCIGTVFLGKMCSSAGHRRLVAVDLVASNSLPNTRAVYWKFSVMTEGTLSNGTWQQYTSEPATMDWFPTNDFEFETADSLREVSVRAGKIDPDHPDHFTIDVNVGSKLLVLDGWLRDDEMIALVRRQEKILTPPPPSSPASSR